MLSERLGVIRTIFAVITNTEAMDYAQSRNNTGPIREEIMRILFLFEENRYRPVAPLPH